MRRRVAACLLATAVGLVGVLGLPPAAAGRVAEAHGSVHYVRRGDSLWKIGRAYGVPWRAIQWANGLRGTVIYPGQALIIPRRTKAARRPVSAWELSLLARLVRAEAEGEPFVGKVAVAAVVLNRVKSRKFPYRIAHIIFQPCQFEPVVTGYIWRRAPDAASWRAVRLALAGWDPTGGALYFYNPAKAYSAFLARRPVTARIGSHVFLR